MTKQIFLVNNLIKKIGVAFAVLIILAAVFSSIFRSLTPWAKQYKPQVEQHLSLLLGQPVTIQSMETGWYWFQPVLKLKQVSVRDKEHHSLHLNKLLIGINLFKSLWHWQIQPGILYIEDIHFNLREKVGYWQIDGISTNAMKLTGMSLESVQHILGWLVRQDRLILRNVSAYFHFSDGALIPVNGLNISVINSGGVYKFKGEAFLLQTDKTTFQLSGDVQFDPFHLMQTKGQIYFAAKNLLPVQWQNLSPQTALRFEGGKGDLSLWVDLKKGFVSSIQAKVKFKRLAWHFINNKNSQLLQSFAANLAWKSDTSGWQLDADHINLRMGSFSWPENKLMIKFDNIQQSYQLYVKSIVVESLLSKAINWPQAILKGMTNKPHGILNDTQIILKNKQLNYFLTRFEQLGWEARENIPQVSNLSGVVNWQPDQGHLELDSENLSIQVKGYPLQKLTLLNGDIEWKQLSTGLRLSIDRLVLSQPELTLSAHGALDEVTQQSMGAIRFAAEFSGKNMQQWLPYLPAQYIKPKLLAWLQNCIKKIPEATGAILVNGLAKDFPFDNNTGEFSIISHGSGAEILISPKWPLIKNIEAYLRLKNRNLDIDLVNGDFHGVLVNQMNLRIDDIGKDKETLLIHTIINAPVQKMIDFVLASPLNQKLATLKILSMQGLALLNLQLELPLYPENNEVLAKGDLSFKNNTLLLKHRIGKIILNDLSGELAFNQDGVTRSALAATAFEYPLNIKIESVKDSAPYTKVLIDGECSVESLKNHFNSPFLSLLNGVFSINASFKLTDNPNDLDGLTLNSTLKGLAVKLPAPLGKTYNTEMPLLLHLDFNAKKFIRFRANYSDLLSTDIMLQEEKDSFILKSGEVRLGSAHALNQNVPGLAVVGTLNGFDLERWKEVFSQLFIQKTNSTLLNNLRIIDVTLDKFTFFKQQFNQLSVKAKFLPDNNWSFNIVQNNISASLTYHYLTHSLSGYIKHLHLDPALFSRDLESPSVDFPNKIPNLNLRVDNLSVGAIQVGNVTLKSHSTAKNWFIDYCSIDSPVYQLNVQGAWTQKGQENQTKLRVKLHLNDLAKSLMRWQITPAVDAGKGDMEFLGGWNDTVYNFSLAGLNGTMQLQLKNGIITNLSKETEEKLGLGKLLSILSLQTIPRRLKLDFSDLSHQGYSFDIFKGNFNLNKGIMTTQDSYLDGPVAYASMKGDLDLVRRRYDLSLHISPHITASLPIVATIAGGPIAGLAAWIANKIINQSMQKITGYSYKISGPWSQPVVQQLSIIRNNKVNASFD